MLRRAAQFVEVDGARLPALPLRAQHWQAIVEAMGLSPRQAEIAELMARGATLEQMAELLGMAVSTIRTQQERIYAKTGAKGRGELLILILDLSHRVGCCGCRQR
jgi:DNA-binding CsgD family transcriptional regulator